MKRKGVAYIFLSGCLTILLALSSCMQISTEGMVSVPMGGNAYETNGEKGAVINKEGLTHWDNENSVISYMRRGTEKDDFVIVVGNFTPVERPVYKIGVPSAGEYEVVLHSNSVKYGGTRRKAGKTYKAKAQQFSDMSHTIVIEVDPNSIMYIKKKKKAAKKPAPAKDKKPETTGKKTKEVKEKK